MLTLTPARPLPSFVQAIAALVRSGHARVRRFAQALKHRREAAMLVELDDRMLRDIGLNRSDLRDAISEPMWRDPTAILASRAAERRINRPVSSPPLQPSLHGYAAPSAPSFVRYY